MKNITILGSTGSIGTQTLDVVRAFPDQFNIVGLSCENNISLLMEQVREFLPQIVRVKDAQDASVIQQFCLSHNIEASIVYGNEGSIDCATIESAHIVVAAMVGVCGLAPVISAINAGKDIALANKETLVAAGALVMPLAKDMKVNILPVDSEHSAVWQCLQGAKQVSLDRIILTASGGPFRGYTLEQLKSVRLEDALAHPTWNMGGKITVDSATMMNKGLEVIEASWLFDKPVSSIDVVVHPQSIIHSMVRFSDGSVLAQMGQPNMTMPIQVALFYPDRGKRMSMPFDPLADNASNLTFESFNRDVFSCVALAYQAADMGYSLPAVMNSANEEAVRAFLDRKISFLEISNIVEKTMNAHVNAGLEKALSLEVIYDLDHWARRYVREIMTRTR